MGIKEKFLKEFTRQILIEINNRESNNLPINIVKEMPQNVNILVSPSNKQLSTHIINEIKNPGLEQYIPIRKDIIIKPIEPLQGYNQTYIEGKLYLGKLTSLINDSQLISIECPGVGRYLAIRRKNQTITSTIILNNEEIEKIIDSFSIMAKIPRIGGVFKAVVNNLLITAIETHNGDRFIISKVPKNIK